MVNVKGLETTEKLKEENENLPYSHPLGPLLAYVALRTFVIATTFLPDPCICPQSSGRLPPRARGFSAIRGRPCSHKASKAPHRPASLSVSPSGMCTVGGRDVAVFPVVLVVLEEHLAPRAFV